MADLRRLRDLAKSNMVRARNCEASGCVFHACDLYEKIIDQISDIISQDTSTSKLRSHQRHLDHAYTRVQELRDRFNHYNRYAILRNQVFIEENALNMDYDKIFEKYLTDDVKEMLIYSPQFSRRSHIKNFIHFMELVVKKCPNLTYVRLATTTANKNTFQQYDILTKVSSCLSKKNITFNFRFMDELNEHMIILNTGYIFQSDHGLNYFHRSESHFTLGICDYGFRKCIRSYFMIWQANLYAQPVSMEIPH